MATATSQNQAIMSLGFSVNQAKAIVTESNRRGLEAIQYLAEICDHANEIKHDEELLKSVRAFLAELIPAEPAKSAGLDKIRSILGGSMPPVPSATAPAPAPAPADNKPRYFNGQAPFSSQGNGRLVWVVSSNVSERGIRYVNIGAPSKQGWRTIGMSAAAWEELLTVHRDELLREIRKLG